MCCNHPYLVDESLRSIEPNFDAEIQMSGKLQLLMKILPEIKRRGIRLVILFQAEKGKITTGDILDDLVKEFFPNSYSRVETQMSRQKKQALLELFNVKEKSVCLLETRALTSGLKLSSVVSIIIFSSDLDPSKELKALEKISVEPRLEELKFFRFYSPYTVEEKALILAKEGLPDGVNHLTAKRRTPHSFLAWGAFHQFTRLESRGASSSNYLDQNIAEDVIHDLLAMLPSSSVGNGFADRCSTGKIKEIQLIDGAYQGNGIRLVGESDSTLPVLDKPQNFWRGLLRGRNPSWKYLPNPSQRSKRKLESIIKVGDECPAKDAREKRRAGNSSAGNRIFRKQPTEMPTVQIKNEAVESSPLLVPNVLPAPLENKNGGVPVTARPGAALHDMENTNPSEPPHETDILTEAIEDAVKVQKEMDSFLESDCEIEIASIRMKYDLLRQEAASLMAQTKSKIESCNQLPLKRKLLEESIQKQHAFIQKQLDKPPPADVPELNQEDSASLA